MNSNDKKQRFSRLAEQRTNKIIKMIRLLSNCSNKSAYEYDETDVRKIFAAIDEELRTARSRFTKRDRTKFTLK